MESVQSGFVKWLLAKIAAAHRLTCFVKKTSVSLSLAEPSSYTVKLAQWTMNHSLAPLHQTFYLKRPFQKLTLQAAHKVKRDTHFFFFGGGGLCAQLREVCDRTSQMSTKIMRAHLLRIVNIPHCPKNPEKASVISTNGQK